MGGLAGLDTFEVFVELWEDIVHRGGEFVVSLKGDSLLETGGHLFYAEGEVEEGPLRTLPPELGHVAGTDFEDGTILLA